MVNEAFDGRGPSLDMLSDTERQVFQEAFSERLATEEQGKETELYDQKIGDLFGKYPPELVWDYYLTANGEERRNNDLHGLPLTAIQEIQETRVRQGEKGEPVKTTSFGLYEPAYANILKPYEEQLRSPKQLNTLLLGSLSIQSSNEFYKLSKRLNPRANAAVMDIGPGGLKKADKHLLKMLGDATEMPIQDNSQDLVFTNALIRFLSKTGLEKPDGEMVMSLIREENRVLKPGGFSVMMEHSPRVDAYSIDDLNFLSLLTHSLESEGFDVLDRQIAERYKDHLSKIKRKQKSTQLDISGYLSKEGKPYYRFSSAILAQKRQD